MTVQLQRTGTGHTDSLITGASLRRSLCAPPPPAWTSAALGGCLADKFFK